MQNQTPMNRTHTGMMFGVVPVFLDMTNPECPAIEGRFLGCEVALSVMESLFQAFCMIMSFVSLDFEPSYAIKITGEVRAAKPDSPAD